MEILRPLLMHSRKGKVSMNIEDENSSFQDGDGWDTPCEFPVFRLMMEEMHGEESSNESSGKGREEKIPF